MNPVTLRPGIGDNRPSATLYYGQDVRETLRTLPEASVHTVCTSPPYWGLRDYGSEGQIGLEPTPDGFVAALVEVFREVKRVLRVDGTLWVNLGDSYAGGGRAGKNPEYLARHTMFGKEVDGSATGQFGVPMAVPEGLKPKDLVGIPWRVAFALQADGWYLRSDIVWSKPNPMPESVSDRCTRAHEYIFLLAHPDSGGRYFYDGDAIKEKSTTTVSRKSQPTDHYKDGRTPNEVAGRSTTRGGKALAYAYPNGLPFRNRRTVWTTTTQSYRGAHFATWPPELVRPMVLAGCPVGGTVLDPFSGSATTGMVALQEGRNYIGVDLNPDYLPMAEARIREERPPAPASESDEDDDGVLGLFGGSE